jgi:hypothetical protein
MSDNKTTSKKNDIGALWKKSGEKDGKAYSFLSGFLTINGEKVEILVRKNDFKKEGEKSADYRIYPNQRYDAKPVVEAKSAKASKKAEPDDDDGGTF